MGEAMPLVHKEEDGPVEEEEVSEEFGELLSEVADEPGLGEVGCEDVPEFFGAGGVGEDGDEEEAPDEEDEAAIAPDFKKCRGGGGRSRACDYVYEAALVDVSK